MRVVLRRSTGGLAPARILQIGGLRMDLDRHEVTVDGQPIETTPTGFEILRVLLENPGHAFTRLQLLEKALGYSSEGLERTLDSHIKNLRKKIEPDPGNPAYIQTVYSIGYRLYSELPAMDGGTV